MFSKVSSVKVPLSIAFMSSGILLKALICICLLPVNGVFMFAPHAVKEDPSQSFNSKSCVWWSLQSASGFVTD